MISQQSLAPELASSRQAVRDYYLEDEYKVIHEMIADAQLSEADRKMISARAAELVRSVRESAKSTIMEKFLAEYGLTTKEGVALMCLAEALLRVPDNLTIQDLIEDKITSGNWGAHVGKAKDRKSTRLNSSHVRISYAVFCLKKKKKTILAY